MTSRLRSSPSRGTRCGFRRVCSQLARVLQVLVVERLGRQLPCHLFTHQLNQNLISDRSQPVNFLNGSLEAFRAGIGEALGGHRNQPSSLYR